MWCGATFLRAYLKLGEDVDLLDAIKDYPNITYHEYHEDLGFFEIKTGDHLSHEVYIKPEKPSKKHQQPFWTKDYRRK